MSLRAQPIRHGSRIEPDARADSERWDAPSLRLFENRNSRDGQHARQFVSRKSVTSHSDLVSKR
jgi:hypothetical protein